MTPLKHRIKARWTLFILTVLALLQTGCATDNSGAIARVEALKIQLDSVAVRFQNIPDAASQQLYRSLSDQLIGEGLFRFDASPRYLTLHTMILSFDDGVLDVQAELYDGETFLGYSRVTRKIGGVEKKVALEAESTKPDKVTKPAKKAEVLPEIKPAPPPIDWALEMDWVAQQLLDQLMAQTPARQRYIRLLLPEPVSPVYSGTPSYGYNQNLGWWRHGMHRGNRRMEREESGKQHKGEIVKHPVPGAISEALPRSHALAVELTAARSRAAYQRQRREQTTAPASSSFWSSWRLGGGGGSGSSSSSDSSSSSSSSSSSGSSWSSGSGSSSHSTYSPPRSHNHEHQRHSGGSSGSSDTSSSSSSSSGGSAPSSHHKKHERD